MSIAPAEIQDQKLKRGLRGFTKESVEKLLQTVAASYEQVWRERDGLRSRLEQLEKEIAPLRGAERELRDILVTAERAAKEIRTQAANDAETLLEQAKAKSRAQETVASEIRAQAARDAEALLEQAREKAQSSHSVLKAQQTRLKDEVDRLKRVEQGLHAELRSFLRSGLQLVEDRDATSPTPITALPLPHDSPGPGVHKRPEAATPQT
ncbi:MAG: DivIVA domain-containing protein [Actinomycetota bacterium]